MKHLFRIFIWPTNNEDAVNLWAATWEEAIAKKQPKAGEGFFVYVQPVPDSVTVEGWKRALEICDYKEDMATRFLWKLEEMGNMVCLET